VLMMTVTESVTVTLVAVRCVTPWLLDVWMAVVQPVSATEAVHCVTVMFIHRLSVMCDESRD